MRKILFALTILAGLAAPMLPAHAGMCMTQCGPLFCQTICN